VAGAPKKAAARKRPKKAAGKSIAGPRRWKTCAYLGCCQGEDGGPARFLGAKGKKFCCRKCTLAARPSQNPDPRTGPNNRHKRQADVPTVVAYRDPSHGHGKLATVIGSPRPMSGRPKKLLRALAREVSARAGEELVRRLGDDDRLAVIATDDLRKLMVDAMKVSVGTPTQVKVSGDGPGGSIPVAVIGPVSAAAAAAAQQADDDEAED
jgi:hypothetical protein